MENDRDYLLPFSELLEQMTVIQLRELLLNKDIKTYATDIKNIEHDIDLIIKEKDIKLSARLLRLSFLMGQINTLIWIYKDKMQESEENYLPYLKLSHQVNGVRNIIKNELLRAIGDADVSAIKTNTLVDGLGNFKVSL